MHCKREEMIVEKWLKESQKGYMRIALLILLSRKPCHGYEMMKEVEDRTGGFWKPTAGGVYPILQSLEESGYIEGKWEPQKRRRKIYRITEAGKLILDRALLKHNQIADNMNSLFEDYMTNVLDLNPKVLPMPRAPNPFWPFLESKPRNKMAALKLKRKHIQHTLEIFRRELQNVNERLAVMKKRELGKKYSRPEDKKIVQT